MKGKIVFEEHMAIQETLGNTKAFAGDSGKWEEFERQILDMDSERIELMDKNGIEFAILSNNAPGVQGILDTNEAIKVARKANDAMAEAVIRNPKRYGAFAALPMQDPDAASESPLIADPDNTLYWQFPIRRLEAETLRDSMLAVGGLLNDNRSGPPVPVMADIVGQWVIGKENLNAGRPGAIIPLNGEEFRKTIFVQWRRSRPLTVLDTFDLPKMEPNCERRNSSTVATQSLFLMNSDFIIQMSEHFAARVRREAGTNSGEQVRHAWRLAFARSPNDGEINEALNFLDAQTEQFAANPVETLPVTNRFDPKAKKIKREPAEVALANLCQLLLSSNEFLYVD